MRRLGLMAAAVGLAAAIIFWAGALQPVEGHEGKGHWWHHQVCVKATTPDGERVTELLREVFGYPYWTYMMEIAWYENDCRIKGESETGDVGFFQINQVHGYSREWRSDFYNNLLAAKVLLEDGPDYRHWGGGVNLHKNWGACKKIENRCRWVSYKPPTTP